VVLGEGGALGCDDIADTGGVTGDGIELAFADDGMAGFEDGAFGLVEGEEDAALGEEGGLG
jgi:hypothetical protein